MQVVEDVEKSLECFFTADFLKIVDDEHINALVEVDKAIDSRGISVVAVCHCCISILHLEITSRDEEHTAVRKFLTHSIAHSIHQVCLAHPRRSIQEEGVEGLHIGILSHSARHVHRCTIADTLAITIEGIGFNEMRIKIRGLRHRRQFCHWSRSTHHACSASPLP